MRWTRFFLVAVACSGLALAACAENTTSPTSDSAAETPSLKKASTTALPTSDELGGRHIVVFSSKNKVPKDFEKAVTALGGTVDVLSRKLGAALVSGLGDAAAAELANRRDILHAELEQLVEMRLPDLTGNRVTSTSTPASPSDPTGAFFFPDQWNMRAIHAPEAWAAGRLGSAGVTVAILDTGIDYLHGDLIGHVDLARSRSFVPEDDAVVDAFFPGRNYISDLVWHGTHVSSNVVSSGYGMAGVTSQVTLMGVKVCSVFGSCPGGAIFAGFLFAVENGADVINMSLGGGFLKKANPGFVSLLNRLFNYARSSGVTIVVASGNDSWDLDHNGNWFSTYCDATHVICVSATGPTGWTPPYDWENVDAPALYSNHGRSAISVAAPGGNTGDLVLGACTQTSLVLPSDFTCDQSPWFYLWGTGTSMSAPHVSGLAALLVEDIGRRPNLVKNRIQQSADDLGQPGTDPWYGRGRINVATAVGAN